MSKYGPTKSAATANLSLVEEAAILRRLLDLQQVASYASSLSRSYYVSLALGGIKQEIERLQASNTACQVSAQVSYVAPGDLPEISADDPGVAKNDHEALINPTYRP